MRGEGGEFLTTKIASKVKKNTATRSLESRKLKVSHSLMVGSLGEKRE